MQIRLKFLLTEKKNEPIIGYIRFKKFTLRGYKVSEK